MSNPPRTPGSRERLSAEELAAVLAHYDLGAVRSAREYLRGSRRSPKIFLKTERGNYVLKRRATGKDDPARVAFTHALMRHLRRKRFPVPRLVRTIDAGQTLLHLPGGVYEVLEYVAAEHYDHSLRETDSAGRALAIFHARVADFHLTAGTPATTTYHSRASVLSSLNAVPAGVSSHDSVAGREAELLSMTQELNERYQQAADAVNRAGIANWPTCVNHGDWHPGNMLFSGSKVAVVLDFDAARVQAPIIDVANGMLQFSMPSDEPDPTRWPDYFDETRMRRFFASYLASRDLPLEQRRAIPPLMIEALISETITPIATTGSFGQAPGFGVMQMVRRKAHWMVANAGRIERWLTE